MIVSTGLMTMLQKRANKLKNQQDRICILSDHFQLLNHWLELKNEGKSITSYFEEKGYQ